MSRKNILEDIAESSLKRPLVGVFVSIFSLGVALYFSFSGGVGGPMAAMFAGAYRMFSYFFYGLSVFAAFFAAIGYFKKRVAGKRRSDFFDSRRNLLALKQLPWRDFEFFVGTFFEKQGYSVEMRGGVKDGGIDLIVKKDGRASFVQCKKYQANQVNLSMVRDFLGALSSFANSNPAFFVTTGTFTLDARKFTEENGIEAIDGSRLMEYLASVPSSYRSGLVEARSSAVSDELRDGRICPDCGAPMVLRVAKKGIHANKHFWGCTKYPKCNAVVEY